MPSVRLLARRESVSISTVVAAYELLERRGWVEARARSGYFVKNRSEDTLSAPKQIRTRPRPLPTTLSQLVMEVQRGSITEGVNFPGRFLLQTFRSSVRYSVPIRVCPEPSPFSVSATILRKACWR